MAAVQRLALESLQGPHLCRRCRYDSRFTQVHCRLLDDATSHAEDCQMIITICSRRIKICDGRDTQTVNVYSVSSPRECDYIVRIPRQFWVTGNELLQRNVRSIEELIVFLQQYRAGKVEKASPSSEQLNSQRSAAQDRLAKDYSEDEIRRSVQLSLRTEPNQFYRDRLLNYSGSTLDTKRKYLEVVAEELADQYQDVQRIGVGVPIRSSKTFAAGHDGNPNISARLARDGQVTYSEKLLAIALFNSRRVYPIGEFFDYEIPLKEKLSDNLGKIDLLAKDENSHAVKIVELKICTGENRGESLLRCLLEVYTYYKLVVPWASNFLRCYGLSGVNWRLQPAVLTDEISLSGKTLAAVRRYPQFIRLVSMMNKEIGIDAQFFVYDYADRGHPFSYRDEFRQQYPIPVGEIAMRRVPL
jgi:hypothetical protein